MEQQETAKIRLRDGISQWFPNCGARPSGFSGKLLYTIRLNSGFEVIKVAAVKRADL